MLKVKLLSVHAQAPRRQTKSAAGYDLYSAYDYSIDPRGKQVIETDISLQVPENCYGRIAPRSGLAVKHSIDVGAGVIDADYRGQVQVLLFNFGDQSVPISRGERVAQLILEQISTPEVQIVDNLDATERGVKGFGSTGHWLRRVR